MLSGMLVTLTGLLLICSVCQGALKEAPDGSVCFNGCNNHGDCIDYSCHCHVGYTGDDCGISKYCSIKFCVSCLISHPA